jgi:curli biogenesis system outer membrane secretion channel CsgG
MRRVVLIAAAISLISGTTLAGCATLDPHSVAASNQVPGHAKVEPVSIVYDPKLPKYLVAVEPFQMNAQEQIIQADSTGSQRGISGQCSSTISNKTVGHGVSSQLITALTNAGNLSVVEMKAVRRNRDGTYRTRIGKGEKGPYIIRETVAEFSENVASSEKSRGASLGWAGTVAGIAGAVTGNRGLLWSGAGVAAANPTFASKEAARTGMIAFDTQVLNGRTGRIVTAFSVAGTVTAKPASNGGSLFGIGGSHTDVAQSAMGQAMRVAMNDAVAKTFDARKGSVVDLFKVKRAGGDATHFCRLFCLWGALKAQDRPPWRSP